MALNQAALSSALQSVFESYPESASDAADAMASAYADYASGGQFGLGAVALAGSEESAMASTLLAAISDPTAGSAATFANAWASALTAFWVGVPITGGQSGASIGCPGASAIVSPLTTLFSNTENTAASCAASLASQLHTATATVTATVTNLAPPPPTVIVPIS